MEQAGCAAGDQAKRSRARTKSVRLVRRLRGGPRQPAPGRLRDPPLGHYDPCARCSLTARPDRRDTQARPGAERWRKRWREPQQGAERRAGLRHWPVISGDPEIGPLARRTIGCGASAPAPVGALLPSFFSGSGNRRRGTRPLSNGPAELCCLTIEDGAELQRYGASSAMFLAISRSQRSPFASRRSLS